MRSLLISDLHLQEQRPDITRALFCLLDQFQGQIDQLFILGDFFEVWLGDDLLAPPAVEVAHRLNQFTQAGSSLLLMHGNRDFLLGNAFAERCGGRLIQEPFDVLLGGKQCQLMHGDTLCTRDTDYMAFREMVRNPQWQQAFLSKSAQERIDFARQARQQSQRDTQQKEFDIMDVTQSEVVRILETSGADILIHGHTHRPATHRVSTSKGEQIRMVLGDWHQQGWYILADGTSQSIELKSFPFPD